MSHRTEAERANDQVEYDAGYNDGWNTCLDTDPDAREGEPPADLLAEQHGARYDGFRAGWADAAWAGQGDDE